MLRQPATVQRMDRLFLPPTNSHESPATLKEALGKEIGSAEIDPAPMARVSGSDASEERAPVTTGPRFDFSAVRDNTYFRPEENAAWFAVFDWLAKNNPNQFATDSIRNVSYAQFVEQPEVYRGQVVTVTGTVERKELLDAPTNDIGIEQYFRLILRPAGGGVWPIVVYSLELPPKFPQNDNATVEVRVTGIFFKNWSYSWQGGLGLAPVVLAKTVEWQPTVVLKRTRPQVTLAHLIIATGVAGAIAALIGWFAWRYTRAPVDVLAGHRVIISPPEEKWE
jgi:hypothetical protein